MENTTQTAKVNETKAVKVATHTVKKVLISFGAFAQFNGKLLSAAREEGTGLKMVVKNDEGKVVQASQMYTAGGKQYSFQEVGRALEVGEGDFLWIEKEELDACKAPSSPEVKITKFVPLSQVDPVFFDSSYYIAPDPGKDKNLNNAAIVAYALLLETLKVAQYVGVAKMEIKGKEHNVIIRVGPDNTLMLHTIFCSSDIRTVNILRPTVAITDQMVEMGLKLIDSMCVDFDPTSVESESDAKFEEMIARKKAEAKGDVSGTAHSAATTSSTANAADALLAALTASLHQAGVKVVADEKPATETKTRKPRTAKVTA
jgi:DNA end-binding protein Ku